MSDILEIDGKTLHSVKAAAQQFSYSRDYVTRLAREQKIAATNIGRRWFVDIDSLRSYVEQSFFEQTVRKKRLSQERKQELEIRSEKEHRHTLSLKKSKSFEARAVAVTALALVVGLSAGYIGYVAVNSLPGTAPQVARTYDTQPSVKLAAQSQVQLISESGAVADDVLVSNFSEKSSFNLQSLGDVEAGILLLPAGAATATMELMFSDPVLVSESADGSTMVVRVDSNGKSVGSNIPFVVVPVEQENI